MSTVKPPSRTRVVAVPTNCTLSMGRYPDGPSSRGRGSVQLRADVVEELALHGAEALRVDWRAMVESENTAFFAELTGDPTRGFADMADRMVEAIRKPGTAPAGDWSCSTDCSP